MHGRQSGFGTSLFLTTSVLFFQHHSTNSPHSLHHGGYIISSIYSVIHLEDLGIDGTIILKLIFKKRDGESRTGLILLRIGTVGGLL
jgi:hypothetical protein